MKFQLSDSTDNDDDDEEGEDSRVPSRCNVILNESVESHRRNASPSIGIGNSELAPLRTAHTG